MANLVIRIRWTKQLVVILTIVLVGSWLGYTSSIKFDAAKWMEYEKLLIMCGSMCSIHDLMKSKQWLKITKMEFIQSKLSEEQIGWIWPWLFLQPLPDSIRTKLFYFLGMRSILLGMIETNIGTRWNKYRDVGNAKRALIQQFIHRFYKKLMIGESKITDGLAFSVFKFRDAMIIQMLILSCLHLDHEMIWIHWIDLIQ